MADRYGVGIEQSPQGGCWLMVGFGMLREVFFGAGQTAKAAQLREGSRTTVGEDHEGLECTDIVAESDYGSLGQAN
jgi:hypothetical protein